MRYSLFEEKGKWVVEVSGRPDRETVRETFKTDIEAYKWRHDRVQKRDLVLRPLSEVEVKPKKKAKKK